MALWLTVDLSEASSDFAPLRARVSCLIHNFLVLPQVLCSSTTIVPNITGYPIANLILLLSQLNHSQIFIDMQSLLRWGIENSNDGGTTQGPQEPHRKLDPEVIDMILGKPDSELMKEALAIAVDEKCEEEERLQALDNFEMVRILRKMCL